jgi:iron complex transport system ATP-binding protein
MLNKPVDQTPISCQQLSYTAPTGIPLLHELNFCFPAGQVTMILGPNGSGKTLLLKCLAGLLRPNQGTVHIGPESLTELDNMAKARLLGWLPTVTTIPFAFTVMDVLLMGRYPIHQGRVSAVDQRLCDQLLSDFQLQHLKHRTVASLSQGEKTKVQLARVLAAEPPILLLDEICANLDINAKISILNRLGKLAQQGRTIIASHHDLHTVAGYADQLIVLKNGSCLLQGPPPEVFTADMIHRAFDIRPRRLETDPSGHVSLLF